MTEIRSFRRVFDLERRIYRVDRLRLNPGGVPVRGIVYFLTAALISLLAGRAPLLGALVRELPWYMRDLALPALSALVLGVIRVEGRPFHLAAHALIRHRLGAGHLLGVDRRASPGEEWVPDELLLLPDGSDGRLRRLRYSGPGAVLVWVEHERTGRVVEREGAGLARTRRHPTVAIAQSAGARGLERGRVIALARGTRLLVAARPRR